MENEITVKYSTVKGLILAFAGAIAGFALWTIVIALLGAGTGGMVGGGAAAVLGMLIAGGYRKGPGRPGIVGIILIAPLAFITTTITITLGTSIIIYQEGLGQNVLESLEILSELLGTDSRLTGAFLQDLIITAGISVVTAAATVGGKKKK